MPTTALQFLATHVPAPEGVPAFGLASLRFQGDGAPDAATTLAGWLRPLMAPGKSTLIHFRSSRLLTLLILEASPEDVTGILTALAKGIGAVPQARPKPSAERSGTSYPHPQPNPNVQKGQTPMTFKLPKAPQEGCSNCGQPAVARTVEGWLNCRSCLLDQESYRKVSQEDSVTFTLTASDVLEHLEDLDLTEEQQAELASNLISSFQDTCLAALMEHLIEYAGEDLSDLADDIRNS